MGQNNYQIKKEQPPTWVCQKWDRIASLNIWNSIEHSLKFEH